MNKKKIFNDPVYGFITIPFPIIFDLIEHPYFQRLRRISQLGLSTYVYPGANHTRFHHAIGALHLTHQALEVLKSKEIEITEEEIKGTCIAILLHDIGHGPFSHTLEKTLLPVHHEQLSLLIMNDLNEQLNGELTTAIAIFEDSYPKKFLHQLISGQLDMDRLDYLNRDSFFTGVSEGIVGNDRIIKMLNVHDGKLVVEEKGIYSLEKFLVSRRLMYWQVYLHKTVVSAEQMLIKTIERAKELYLKGENIEILSKSLKNLFEEINSEKCTQKMYTSFLQLDDYDIIVTIKNWMSNEDFILKMLSYGIINRRLFKIEIKNIPFESDYVESIRQKLAVFYNITYDTSKLLVWTNTESNTLYNNQKDEILILNKQNEVTHLSAKTDYSIESKIITKYFLCYPKI